MPPTRRSAIRLVAPILSAALWLLPVAARAQCAMCNTAATGNDVGRGLSISVPFLLGTLGVLVLAFAVLVRMRADAREERSPLGEEAADRSA